MTRVEPELTLLLTAYNEASTMQPSISEFYEEISKKVPLKILVVEDGSTDGTKEILLKLKRGLPMDLLQRENRRGYSKAVIEGLRCVDTKLVFFTDGDGQHVAKDFWKLFELREKFDMVSGWRVIRADFYHRRLMSSVFQWIARRLSGIPRFNDITAPYKLMRSDMAKLISNECTYMKESFWTEFTIRAHKRGFKIAEVPVSHRRRIGGVSTRVYQIRKIPKIVFSQLIALLKLWWEFRGK